MKEVSPYKRVEANIKQASKKADEVLKNELGFVAYEFDQFSSSAPKNRTILQIIFTIQM